MYLPGPFSPRPVGMSTNMVGNINIEKYRIRSISIISEATWTPKILIRHFDGSDFSYSITREQIEDNKSKNGGKYSLDAYKNTLSCLS